MGSEMIGKISSKEKLIMIVDDEESIRKYLEIYLSSEGYEVASADGGEEALTLIKQGSSPSLVVLDIMMPEMDGFETLRKIREIDKTLPVVVLSAIGQTESVVRAMKLGASDYLSKPFDDEELSLIIGNALGKAPAQEREDLPRPLDLKNDFLSINPEMIQIKEMIGKIAGNDATVLILGESGVGKELIARSVHDQSLRSAKTLVRINCAALPSELLESELFGFERGAFTGALQAKKGKFELADGGTIFLDEIGEMSPLLQAKLLHVLQDGSISKLGSDKDLTVDVRVVAATNQNLEKAIKEKRFREDLYYRLNVVKIIVPPLRERKEDIPLLCQHFFKKFKQKYQSDIIGIPEALMNAFMTYSWPGNIRELENLVRRFVVLEDTKYILKELAAIPRVEKAEQAAAPVLEKPLSLKELSKKESDQIERYAILKALMENRWNKKKASAALNISVRALHYKIKEYGLATKKSPESDEQNIAAKAL